MEYKEPVIITKGNIKLKIEFDGDIATIHYYFKDEIVDTMVLPRTNNAISFVTQKTKYKENTVRRYIYNNKREQFEKENLITFQGGTMNILDIESLIKTFKKDL